MAKGEENPFLEDIVTAPAMETPVCGGMKLRRVAPRPQTREMEGLGGRRLEEITEEIVGLVKIKQPCYKPDHRINPKPPVSQMKEKIYFRLEINFAKSHYYNFKFIEILSATKIHIKSGREEDCCQPSSASQ